MSRLLAHRVYSLLLAFCLINQAMRGNALSLEQIPSNEGSSRTTVASESLHNQGLVCPKGPDTSLDIPHGALSLHFLEI